MRNLKKSLALIVVLAMSLTMLAGAAYTDVPLSYDYGQAIDLLSDLQVLNGYTDGTFKPEGTITRAEACAVIYRMLSAKLNASNFTGATKFSDVAASFWGTGYINYCTELGIVNGYPDGTFRPDLPVTYAEMTTMIVRALGLDKFIGGASKNLSYPGGYIAQADLNAINDDVELSANDPANRGSVAQLVYNAIFNAPYTRIQLDVDDKSQTVAEYVFGIDDTDVIITDVGAYGAGLFPCDSDEFSAIEVDGDFGTSADYLFKAAEFAGLSRGDIGKAATVYTDDDDDVVAVVFSKDNAVVTVPAVDYYKDAGKYYYKLDGAEKTITFNNTIYVLNGDIGTAADLAQYEAKDRYPTQITFISNDGSDKSIELVFISEFAYAEVDAVDDESIFLTEKEDYLSTSIDYSEVALFDDSDDAFDVQYPSSLKKDDLVLIYKDADDDKGAATIILCEELEGKFTRRSGSDYTIGGKAYKLAKTGVTAPASLGDTYEFVVDGLFGYIVDTDSSDADVDDYYYIESVRTKSANYASENATYLAKTYNSLGEMKELTIDKKFVTGNDESKAVIKPFATAGSPTTSPYTGAVVILDVNSSGKITDFTALSSYSQGVDEDDSYSSKTGLLRFKSPSNVYSVEDDTILFFIDDDDDVTVYIGTVPTYDPNVSTAWLSTNADDEIVAGVFFAETRGTASATEDIYGYVSKVAIIDVDSDDAYAELTIAAQGKVEVIETEVADSDDIEDLLGAENRFLKYDLTSAGKIKYDDIDDVVIYNSQADVNSEDDEGTDDLLGSGEIGLLYFAGEITDVSTSRYYIGLEGGALYDIADEADVYTIDRDGKTAKVSSIGSLQKSAGSYNRYATILYDDDEEEIIAIWYENYKTSDDFYS